jgi:hypothetical protein
VTDEFSSSARTFSVAKLDVANGNYTDVFSVVGVDSLNAAAINPVDGMAYAITTKVGSTWLVRGHMCG